jgi:hypothetical protein
MRIHRRVLADFPHVLEALVKVDEHLRGAALELRSRH